MRVQHCDAGNILFCDLLPELRVFVEEHTGIDKFTDCHGKVVTSIVRVSYLEVADDIIPRFFVALPPVFRCYGVGDGCLMHDEEVEFFVASPDFI